MEKSLMMELRDVISKIDRFTIGLDLKSFRKNDIIISAVSFELLRIEDIIRRIMISLPQSKGADIVTLKYIRSACIGLCNLSEEIDPHLVFRIISRYLSILNRCNSPIRDL